MTRVSVRDREYFRILLWLSACCHISSADKSKYKYNYPTVSQQFTQ